jgi:hypothetical protein
MATRRKSNEERYRSERDECRREIKRYRRERDSCETKLKHCHSELDDYVMLSRHLRKHIKFVESGMVNAIPVQEYVPPKLHALIAEPVLSGEVVELEPEPEPETKPEERDLVDEMMKLGREAGWDLPPIAGETWKNYFKRLIKYKRGKKSRGCCGSRPRMKKKQTKRRKEKKQTKKYKKMKY